MLGRICQLPLSKHCCVVPYISQTFHSACSFFLLKASSGRLLTSGSGPHTLFLQTWYQTATSKDCLASAGIVVGIWLIVQIISSGGFSVRPLFPSTRHPLRLFLLTLCLFSALGHLDLAFAVPGPAVTIHGPAFGIPKCKLRPVTRFQPITTLKRSLKVYNSFVSVLIDWKRATNVIGITQFAHRDINPVSTVSGPPFSVPGPVSSVSCFLNYS